MRATFDPPLPQALLRGLELAQRVGAIGPAPLEEHVEHARGFADVIAAINEAPSSILDLGTGGGIPGLVLALHFPLTTVTLLDGRAGRIELLNDLAETLEWGERLQIVGERAERFGRNPEARGSYEYVVARGFARPAPTGECASPLLRSGGALVVSEPPEEVEGRSRWPSEGCALLGLEPRRDVKRGFHYAVLEKVAPCPDSFPRRVGIPEKRPLF